MATSLRALHCMSAHSHARTGCSGSLGSLSKVAKAAPSGCQPQLDGEPPCHVATALLVIDLAPQTSQPPGPANSKAHTLHTGLGKGVPLKMVPAKRMCQVSCRRRHWQQPLRVNIGLDTTGLQPTRSRISLERHCHCHSETVRELLLLMPEQPAAAPSMVSGRQGQVVHPYRQHT